MISADYFNPFSERCSQAWEDFKELSLEKKVIAIAAAVFGAILTPFFLFTGGVALFRLTVEWLKTTASVGEEQSSEVDDPPPATTFKLEVTDEDLRQGFTGEGVYRISDDQAYYGGFLNGQRHGSGQLTVGICKVYNCEYSLGVLISKDDHPSLYTFNPSYPPYKLLFPNGMGGYLHSVR